MAHVVMMEQVSIDIIQVIALIMKAVVVAWALTMLIVGLFEVVQEEVRESRWVDEIAQETPPAAEASRTVVRQNDHTRHPV